jgi:16S rRNA (adenine1518-N6/adenine1519-N6)-dimethyltransferase
MVNHPTGVKPKKFLGQHFLTDNQIAFDISAAVHTLPEHSFWLEIGPGTGVLTQHLLARNPELAVVETDRESVEYLKHQTWFTAELIADDFLKFDLDKLPTDKPLVFVGNFPYNISSQIVFKAIENHSKVCELTGMFQKEVAERIAAKPGKKDYGILSVLAQAFFHAEYLFTVEPHVFNPPPKVRSGVIRLLRNDTKALPCNEKLFFEVVKTAFNQRRKVLSNALKSLFSGILLPAEIAGKRAEQLSVDQFISLTLYLEQNRK